MTSCVVVLFFYAWTRETVWQNFWKCACNEAKQLTLGEKSDAHVSNWPFAVKFKWGKYREAARCYIKIMYTVKYVGPKYFSWQLLKDERTKSSSPFPPKHPTQLQFFL